MATQRTVTLVDDLDGSTEDVLTCYLALGDFPVSVITTIVDCIHQACRPANVPNAPTTVDGWRAYLTQHDGDVSTIAHWGKSIDGEAEFDYLSPKSRAALLDPSVVPTPWGNATMLVQKDMTALVETNGNTTGIYYYAWDARTLELMHPDGPNHWQHVTQKVVDEVGDTA